MGVTHSSLTSTIASGASDCSVKIWEQSTSEEKFVLLQSVSLGSGFVFGVDLYYFYEHLMLALGTDTGKVEMYVKQDSEVSQWTTVF